MCQKNAIRKEKNNVEVSDEEKYFLLSFEKFKISYNICVLLMEISETFL